MIRTRSGLIVPRHDRRFGTIAEKDWRRDGLHIVRDLGWDFSEQVHRHGVRRTFTYKGGAQGADRQYFRAIQEPQGSQMIADQTAITGTTEALMFPYLFTQTFAYSLRAGNQIFIEATGVTTTPASAATTMTINPRYGTTTGGTSLGISNTSGTALATQTNVPWVLRFTVTVRSIGNAASTMSITGAGTFTSVAVGTAALPGTLAMGGTTLTTADSTTAQAIVFGAVLGGSASWTLTTRTVAFEISN